MKGLRVFPYSNLTWSYRSKLSGKFEVRGLECPQCRGEVEPLLDGQEEQCRCGVHLKREGDRLLLSPAIQLDAA